MMGNPCHRLVLLLPILVSLACGSSGELTAMPTASPLPQPTATQSRCEPASAAQTGEIRHGVQQEQASNDIGEAFAVRSSDFEQVWFVAAMIIGPGIEGGTGPGVWAVGGEKESPGQTLSVNTFALEFSYWIDAFQTDAAITMANDGAREAEVCALGNAAQ